MNLKNQKKENKCQKSLSFLNIRKTWQLFQELSTSTLLSLTSLLPSRYQHKLRLSQLSLRRKGQLQRSLIPFNQRSNISTRNLNQDLRVFTSLLKNVLHDKQTTLLLTLKPLIQTLNGSTHIRESSNCNQKLLSRQWTYLRSAKKMKWSWLLLKFV